MVVRSPLHGVELVPPDISRTADLWRVSRKGRAGGSCLRIADRGVLQNATPGVRTSLIRRTGFAHLARRAGIRLEAKGAIGRRLQLADAAHAGGRPGDLYLVGVGGLGHRRS